MNRVRECERTTSRECGSTYPTLIAPRTLWRWSQISTPARRRQHLQRPWHLIAIGQRNDGIVIQSVLPIALDVADADLAGPSADFAPQTARGDAAVQFRC